MAKVRGHRIELDEIERLLAAHPQIGAAAVTVVDDGQGGQRIDAFAAATPGSCIDGRELRAWLRERLALAALPTRIEVLPELPRTPQGKVDLAALRTVAERAPAIVGSDTVPADALATRIAAAFATVLAVPVGIDDDFFAVGGDSLAAIRVLDVLRRESGREVPLKLLFARPQPRALASAMAATPSSAAATSVAADESAPITELADDFPRVVAPRRSPLRVVLVTGGTGFFGRHVRRELLARTSAEIVVLHRGASAPVAAPRERMLRGELAAPRLGLDAAAHDRLLREVDAVVHVAANTNVALPWSSLRRDNEGGTAAVLAFCARGGAHLHHVSTAGIFAAVPLPPGGNVDETFDIASIAAFDGGYARSKWGAERLVAEAARRGIATTIYRPGRLVAGRDGGAPPRDFGAALFALGLELGSIPDLDLRIDLTPVDWAAAALVTLAQRAEPGRVWHLLEQEPTPLAELHARLVAAGLPLRRLPYGSWHQRLLASPAVRRSPAIAALAASLHGDGPPPAMTAVASARTHAALAGERLPSPTADIAALLEALDEPSVG